MEENDILKRIEKLEQNSHPPVSWQKKIEGIIKRIDLLTNLYGEIINNLTKQKKQNLQKQLINYYKENNMEFLSNNWEYVLIGILCVDKIVALSPTAWDDLIWTSVKKALYKMVGKQMLKRLIAKYVAKHGLIPILKKVGDIAVGVTKSKKDDEAWAKIKRVIDDLDG